MRSVEAGRLPEKNEKFAEVSFRAMLRTCGLVKRVMHPYFARFGVSGAQWGVLRTLHRAEAEGLRQLRLTDVSERLLLRPPSITAVVDRLQRMGLVARKTTSDDQRAKHLSLTPAGRLLVRRVLREHNRQIKLVMSGLTAPEQRRLGVLLNRLASHLEASAEPGKKDENEEYATPRKGR